jgi:hypothetical protein
MSRLGTMLQRIASGSSAGALLVAKYAIGPVLKLQAVKIRRTVPRLPEAAGGRSGFADPIGTKQGVSVLIVGDSSAAGVGVATQDHALAAQIASHLAFKIRRSVRWRLPDIYDPRLNPLLRRDGTAVQSARSQIERARLNQASAMRRGRR